MRRHALFLPLLASALGLCAPALGAPLPRYRCIVIPGTYEALDVNNLGEVVGRTQYSGSSTQAFHYRAGQFTPFGPGSPYTVAYAISDSGHIAGVTGSNDEFFAMTASREGVVSPVGGLYSEAWDVNNEGVAVGFEEDSYGIHLAKSWGGLGGGGLATGPQVSGAYGINTAGDIVGMYDGDAVWFDGFPLPVGGVTGSSSAALAVSDSGVVAGYSYHGSGIYEAWARRPSGLASISYGTGTRWAWDVNRFGQVVGSANGVPFVWDAENGYHDLASLVSDGSATLYEAWGINDAGVIVGMAEEGGYLLVPIDSLAPGNADTDGDGLLDRWERFGLDLDVDGVREFRLEGADPMHKDLYVEIDVTTGQTLRPEAVQAVVDAFAAVPGADLPAPNPDGAPGITLHVLVDETDLPEPADLPVAREGADFFPAEFATTKLARFGTAAERADANAEAILAARAYTHRYGILWPVLEAPVDSIASSAISGMGECPGNDFILATPGTKPIPDTWQEQAGTLMHELGHTLGLGHGGGDALNFKPNYFSVMNYMWQVPSGPVAPNWRLDYSRTASNRTLDESALDEAAGLTGISREGASVPVVLNVGAGRVLTRMTGAANVNFNDNGGIDAGTVAQDLNALIPVGGPSPGEVLYDHDDWSGLVMNFRTAPSFPEGIRQSCLGAGELEYTSAVHDLLATAPPPDVASADGAPGGGALRLGLGPSPFTYSLAIAFTLPAPGRARVTVHDVSGRRVATLLDDSRPAGPVELGWDARDARGRAVAAGIYFVRVETPAGTAIGRIVRM